jgi:AcrR family transcriptional regulator
MTGGPARAGRSRPGRHRSRAIDEAILRATLDVLRERGYAALTVAAVIERAGVSSATLYRRWTTKQDLVAAAVDFLVPERLVGQGATLEADLEAFLRHVLATMAARGALANDLAVESGRHPELAAALRDKLLRPRLAELDAIVARAVARGEIAPPCCTEDALSLVVGAVYHRATMFDGEVSPAFGRAAVQGALAGLRVAGGAGRRDRVALVAGGSQQPRPT